MLRDDDDGYVVNITVSAAEEAAIYTCYYISVHFTITFI